MVKAKKTAAKKTKKKERVILPHARVSIRSTLNNTIVAVTDMAGNVLTWSSGGKIGFKGSRKGTPFAAQLAAQDVAKQAKDLGVRSVEVEINDETRSVYLAPPLARPEACSRAARA